MTIEIALIISAVSLFFGIFQGISNLRRNAKQDTQRETNDISSMRFKIDNIESILQEFKEELSAVKNHLSNINERLAFAEHDLSYTQKKLDKFEKTKKADC